MATLRIVNEKEDITHGIDGYVAPFIIEQGLVGYTFFSKNISQENKATYDDFFSPEAEIVALRYVGGGFSALDWVKTVATGGFYAIYKMTRKPKSPGYNFSGESSANNTIGGRSNDQRLGKRIEDIWGNDPQIFPSILSTYTRFDDTRNEVECSILCAGVGNLALSSPKENDYSLSDIPTTALGVYQKFPTESVHKPLGGTPTQFLGQQSLKFPPLSVKQNKTISGFELKNEETKTPLVFCFGDLRSISGEETIYYYYASPDSPPTVTVNTRGTGTASITVVSTFVDFVAAGYAIGQKVVFNGFAKRVSSINYNDCSTTASIITGVSTNSIDVDITYQPTPLSVWDILTLSTPEVLSFGYPGSGPTYDYLASNGNVVSVLNTDVFYSPITTIEFDGGTTTTYLCNFECPQGTSVNNVGRLRVYYDNDTSSVQSFTFTKDDQPQKRVGYTVNLSFNISSPLPIRFTWERATATTDSLILRDVYKTEDMSSFYDDGTTMLRLERYYNSFYGGGNEMKLSLNATRYVYKPVVNPDGTWQLGTEYSPSNHPMYYIPNLHVNQFNGRKSPSSLDIQTLNGVMQYEYGVMQGSHTLYEYGPYGGVTFDESNLKYEDELKQILGSFECDVFQIGSKIYTTIEKPDVISMQFTHRDFDTSTFKRTRIFRRQGANDGVRLTYKNLSGESTIITYPTNITLNNPLEITLKAAHEEYQAYLTLYREWFKILYQKYTCNFTAGALGRQCAPGMVISVVDPTREDKTDGELLATETVAGKLVATTSQKLPATISNVTITDEEGEASTWPVTRTSDYSFTFSTTPSVTVYSGWEKQKTRYQAFYNSVFDKYIVTNVDVKSYDEVEITCINYDDRYYQYDNVASRP